jgi:hypothetical protein
MYECNSVELTTTSFILMALKSMIMSSGRCYDEVDMIAFEIDSSVASQQHRQSAGRSARTRTRSLSRTRMSSTRAPLLCSSTSSHAASAPARRPLMTDDADEGAGIQIRVLTLAVSGYMYMAGRILFYVTLWYVLGL